MKPIFAIDITTDKKNEKWNSDLFIAASAESTAQESLKQHTETVEKKLEVSAKLPLPLRIIRTVCGYLFLAVLLGILRAVPNVGLRQGYKNAPFLFWLCGALLLVFAVLQIWSWKRSNKVLKSEDTQKVLQNIQQSIDEIHRTLQVPQDAIDTDLLIFHYKMKNGNPIAKAVGFSTTEYTNIEVKLFVRDGVLCVADNEHRYEFPLESLKRIRTVKKRIAVPFWNKEKNFDQEPYRQYKITSNNLGLIFFKTYYILELERDGETHGIYFPVYELPTLKALLKMYPEAAE